MSSTNRSNAREDHVADYYVTPINCIRDFFTAWKEDVEDELGGVWLDPCAGGDKNHHMSYPEFISNELGIKTKTIDIREDSLAEIKADFLEMKFQNKYDVVITNPPFNKAVEIIEKALDVCKDGGYVVMLLRLNFFGGKLRQEFWDKQMPTNAYIHRRRMSFLDNGGTDSIEYMHAVWKKGEYPKFTKIRII